MMSVRKQIKTEIYNYFPEVKWGCVRNWQHMVLKMKVWSQG